MPADGAEIDRMIGDAQARLREGDRARAEALYEAALEADPNHFAALQGLGLMLLQAGRTERSAAFLRRAAASRPDAWTAFSYLGAALRRLQPDESLAAYDRALALNPGDALIHNNRGNVLLDIGRAAEAEAAFKAAVERRPDFAMAWVNLGRALFRQDRFAEALAAIDAGLAIAPDAASAHRSRADALMGLARWPEAVASYDRAVELAPADPHTHQRRARALMEADFLAPVTDDTSRAALAAFDRALALDPDFSEARWGRALTRLRRGRFAEGWDDYEHRWRAGSFVSRSAGLVTPALQRRLDFGVERADLAGKRVLLVAEQGLGDIIMFASIIPDLMALAGEVTLLCEMRLHRLFGASFPGLVLLAPGAPVDPFDTVLALGSLGRLFRLFAADMPGTPYLTASPEARADWAARLGPKAARLRIGVSWRGGVVFTGASERSLDVEQLAPVLDLKGCQFITLQYGDTAADLARVNAGRANPVQPPPGPADDIDDLAALVQSLDLVVSVQTAVVHLAGALGVPCLAMIPRKPEWRYGMGQATMPWYRSVDLFRQGPDGDWGPVLARVAAEVARRRDGA